MLDPTTSLQLLLGTDKHNPCLCLYTNADESELHLYYGLELFQVVPNQRESPAYRLLAAQLYNAGLRVATVAAVLGLDRKTLRTLGRALRSGDPAALVTVLAGRRARRKLTPEVEGYVRARWPVLRAQGVRDYRRQLRAELARVLGVKVSGETLRPLFNQLRQEAAAPPPTTPTPNPVAEPVTPAPVPLASVGSEATIAALAVVAANAPSPIQLPLLELPPPPGPADATAPPPAPPAPANPEPLPPIPVVVAAAPSPPPPAPPATPPGDLGEAPCVSRAPAACLLSPPRNLLPPSTDWSVGQTRWCEHAGVLLFAPALLDVSGVVNPAQPWLRQALGSVLAGALNVEQTKYLNLEDLECLLGPQVRGLGPQRRRLKALAELPTADALLRWNAQRVGTAAQSDFYFDPHTKHYTGLAAVLKGWCPTIRWADKALHSDFLHTVTGQPLYFECTDNYEDLRTRLGGVLTRARTALDWPKEKILTLVIDRAIFGHDTFEQILTDPTLHLITWQKGYQPGGWDDAHVSGQCVLERPRNRAADVQRWQFRWMDQPWAADPRWRQLIVQATNPAGRTVEVAVLTDDLARPGDQIVRRIFGRWVQENDFKYLDQHFGINQITSYGTVAYTELKGQLTDRQMQNGVWRAHQEQARQLRAQLGRLLWAEREAQNCQAARQVRRAELEAPAPAPAAVPGADAAPAAEPGPAAARRRRELTRLKAAATRHTTRQTARQQQIAALETQLAQTLAQAAQTDPTVSRLDTLIARGMVRLDTGPKRLLDAIKVVARNEFYRALAPFRTAYDNYRDDHEHFRRLTQSAGVLRWNGRSLEVHLLPAPGAGARLRQVWAQVLAAVNAAGPRWPDDSGHPLHFRLAERSTLEVRLPAD